MSLMSGLVLRLVGVALFCLAGTVVFVAIDTRADITVELKATEARVAYQLERFYMLGSAGTEGHEMKLRSIELVSVMAPGTCIALIEANGEDRRLCAGWNVFGKVAPGWFRQAVQSGFGPLPSRIRDVRVFQTDGRELETSFDPVAAATRMWQQARIVGALAAAITLAMSVLTALAIIHALTPVQAIVDGLKRLEAGDIAHHLPSFRTAEFRRMAGAVNDLADRLERATSQRAALMRQLFEVQEAERRGLARELHDEFGQCLTAAGALAASIEAGSPRERSDLCRDARSLATIMARMMTTLRGAFVRLRPPDLDEVGLEASLRTLVHGWNASTSERTSFGLRFSGDPEHLDEASALAVYRIAQECLTNAARHGSPRAVVLTVACAGRGGDGVTVIVDDDGGGHVDAIRTSAAGERGSGFGILGIRERVSALGGTLTISARDGGIRVKASIPMHNPDGSAVARPLATAQRAFA